MVDVQVVTRTGRPIDGLGADDFAVRFGRDRRQVLSADFVAYPSAPDLAGEKRSPPGTGTDPAGGTASAPRRLYVLAVDESSFSPLTALAWREAIRRFIQQLQPDDLAAFYAYPLGGPLVEFTDRHELLLDAADRIAGSWEPPTLRYYMTISEMVDITRGDEHAARRVADRECGGSGFMFSRCLLVDVPEEARTYGQEIEMRMARSIAGLRELFRSVRAIEERKTVVVVSGGLFAADEIGARGNVNDLITAVGQEATAANVNLYVLHLDTSFIELHAPRARVLASVFRDAELYALGLSRFAGIAGGELIRVQAGTGDYAFERVLLETSSYYLLAVRPEEADRTGRPRRITVTVNRPGAVVRSRDWVVVPAK